MGPRLLNHKPTRRGRRNPWAAPPPPRPAARFRKRGRPEHADGQLYLFRPAFCQVHPEDACQWCGQEPTTFLPDGSGWCLAHTPADAFT